MFKNLDTADLKTSKVFLDNLNSVLTHVCRKTGDGGQSNGSEELELLFILSNMNIFFYYFLTISHIYILSLGYFKPSYLLLSCPTPPLKSSPVNFPTCTDGLLFVAVVVGSAAVVGLLIETNL